MKLPFEWKPGWDTKVFIKRSKIALFAGLWLVAFILPLYTAVKGFPLHGSVGDIVYMLGRLFGLFGLFYLAFVISSRMLFNQLKKTMDPVKFNKALHIIEIYGLTLIFLHPILLVAGRYLMKSLNPFDIIIPNFSGEFYVFIAFGCAAFWMMFIAGIIYLNRNKVSLNKYWKYFHFLIYPAFFLSMTHAHMIGTSSSYPPIDATYQILCVVVVFSMLVKTLEILLKIRSKALKKYQGK